MNTLLLDRDGVLDEERDNDYAPDNIRLLPGVAEGLKQLASWRRFVISNQSGVARGFFTAADVEACNERLRELLLAEGVSLGSMLFCPHHPDDGCACRKPRLGMWEELKKKYHLRPEDCVMVGNRSSDVAFGRAIGCFTVMIPNVHPIGEFPDLIVPDLPTLASFLLRHPTPVPPVMTMEQAVAYAERSRVDGKKIVTTNGAFDLLHPGHLFLLEQARMQGDVLIVGVNSDASVRRYKGPDRPIEQEAVRALKVAAHADAVFIFDDDDPRPWLPKIRPHVHANASTYGNDSIEAPVLKEIAASLVLVPVKPELGSTSSILRS
ncbi:MAG: rfaE bifunctional protein [Candidatus Peregrinibacteria bacterium Greene0416_19]|nr:MAG: rfaE bifunctional protein [Candidatus Peregrinibacteria bacterium Greene0416_19]